MDALKFQKRNFPVTQKRILLKNLEFYYCWLLHRRMMLLSSECYPSITAKNLEDQKLRVTLKSCEMMLVALGSQLFEDDQKISIKKTRTINGKEPSKPT